MLKLQQCPPEGQQQRGGPPPATAGTTPWARASCWPNLVGHQPLPHNGISHSPARMKLALLNTSNKTETNSDNKTTKCMCASADVDGESDPVQHLNASSDELLAELTTKYKWGMGEEAYDSATLWGCGLGYEPCLTTTMSILTTKQNGAGDPQLKMRHNGPWWSVVDEQMNIKSEVL